MAVFLQPKTHTMAYLTLEDTIGNTPLVQLQRLPGDDARRRNNIILGKNKTRPHRALIISPPVYAS